MAGVGPGKTSLHHRPARGAKNGVSSVERQYHPSAGTTSLMIFARTVVASRLIDWDYSMASGGPVAILHVHLEMGRKH